MGRRRWATPAQTAWLSARYADFLTSQQQSTTAVFHTRTFQAWLDAFPIPEPTATEIAAEGSVEKAKESKLDVMNGVSAIVGPR